jgi:hypothetical protein
LKSGVVEARHVIVQADLGLLALAGVEVVGDSDAAREAELAYPSRFAPGRLVP